MRPEEKFAFDAWLAQHSKEERKALRNLFYNLEPGIWCAEPTDMADPMIIRACMYIADEKIAGVEKLALLVDMRASVRRMDSHNRSVFQSWLRERPCIKHIAILLEPGSFRFVFVKYFFSVMRYQKFSLSTSKEQALERCRAVLASV